MSSLRNGLAAAACEMIENGRTVIYLEELMRETYPDTPIGPGFLQDGLQKLLSVMRKTESDVGTPNGSPMVLVPLSEYFFENHLEEPPATEKDARRCVPGTFPGTGPAVGFRVPSDDAITKVWIKYGNSAASGQVEHALRKSTVLCGMLGMDAPKSKLVDRLSTLAIEGMSEDKPEAAAV